MSIALNNGASQSVDGAIDSLRQDHGRVLNSQALCTKNHQIVKLILDIRSKHLSVGRAETDDCPASLALVVSLIGLCLLLLDVSLSLRLRL